MLVDSILVVQAPIAAHCPFLDAFPWLVKGLNQVVLPMFLFGQGNEAPDKTGLVFQTGQRPFPHPSLGRPAGFADDDFFVRDFLAELFPDLFDMGHGRADRDRVILPVGQDMDHDKIADRSHLWMLKPKLPDIGIGDSHSRQGSLDLIDISGKLFSGDLPTEQGLVANYHCPDYGGIFAGKGDQPVNLLLI